MPLVKSQGEISLMPQNSTIPPLSRVWGVEQYIQWRKQTQEELWPLSIGWRWVFLSQADSLTMKGKTESDSYLVSCWYNHGQNAQQRSTTSNNVFQVAQEPDSKVCNLRRWMDEAEGSGLWQISGSFLLKPVWKPLCSLNIRGLLATNIDGTLCYSLGLITAFPCLDQEILTLEFFHLRNAPQCRKPESDTN